MVGSWWRSKGGGPLEARENLHLTVPKSGSNIAQQCVDGYAFFHVHCSTKLGFWGLQDTLEKIFWDLLVGPGACFQGNFESGASQIGILGQTLMYLFSTSH